MPDPNPSFAGPASAGYDAAEKWSPPPDWTNAEIRRDGWRARPCAGLHRLAIAGRVDLAAAAFAPGAPMLGLWEEMTGDVAVLRVGREKALVESRAPLHALHGWNAAGWAAAPASDAWMAVEIDGGGLRDLVAQGTGADLDGGSPSAMVLFAGVPALLVRTAPDAARITVEAGFAPYLWRWLEGA